MPQVPPPGRKPIHVWQRPQRPKRSSGEAVLFGQAGQSQDWSDSRNWSLGNGFQGPGDPEFSISRAGNSFFCRKILAAGNPASRGNLDGLSWRQHNQLENLGSQEGTGPHRVSGNLARPCPWITGHLARGLSTGGRRQEPNSRGKGGGYTNISGEEG